MKPVSVQTPDCAKLHKDRVAPQRMNYGPRTEDLSTFSHLDQIIELELSASSEFDEIG